MKVDLPPVAETLFVVACSASKHPAAAPWPRQAQHAYTGAMFQISREWIVSHRWKWCILSGGYGFLWPDTIIEHYNERFHPREDTSNWEPFESIRQKQYGRLRTARHVCVLGSALYARIASEFLEREVAAPLAGLPIGRMLQRLKLLVQLTESSHLNADCQESN